MSASPRRPATSSSPVTSSSEESGSSSRRARLRRRLALRPTRAEHHSGSSDRENPVHESVARRRLRDGVGADPVVPRRAGEVVRTLDTFAGARRKQWWPNRDRRAYSPGVDLTAPVVATDEKEAARVRLLLLGICLFGAALRVVHLGQASLWLDELTSWSLSHHASLAEVLRDARHDFHPPGHLVILYGTQQLLGDSEASLRLPSLVAGVASLPLL